MEEETRSWREIDSLEGIQYLIDQGILLQWKDMKIMKKNLSLMQQREISAYFAKTVCENIHDRAFCEITVESFLVWIVNLLDEESVSSFIQRMLKEEHREASWKTFIEIALAGDVTDSNHDLEMFSTGVGIVCQMGVLLEQSEGQEEEKASLLDFIATYLLSIANNNLSSVRMSLLHYFGHMSVHNVKSAKAFNRVMNRFGHTVLDNLFLLLFNRKSEGVALQYLVQNLPYIFNADNQCQRILHETFKYYMLKKPDRFILFIQILADHLDSKGSYKVNCEVFIQHLAALFRVAAEVGHRELAKEVVLVLQRFASINVTSTVISALLADDNVKLKFKSLLKMIQLNDQSKSSKDVLKFLKSTKRGRKPAFVKIDAMSAISQISYLSAFDIAS